MDLEADTALQGAQQTKLQPQQKARLLSPAMSTPPSLTTAGSSPEIEDDKASTCSDRCSQAACSDCCESDHCSPECLPSCDGFVDCDDDDFCTNADCAEEACLDTAPPCFDVDCLQAVHNADFQSSARPQEFTPSWDITTTDQPFNDLLWIAHAAAPSPLLEQSFALSQYPPLGNASTAGGAVISNEPLQSPAKRRKVSSELGQNSQQYVFGSTQHEQIVETTEGYPAQCKWVQGGSQCDTTLYGWRALDYHVQEQHIKPQTSLHCQWNHCKEDVDPSGLLSHVKGKHSPTGNEHVCLWQGCDAMFEDADDLDRHLKTGHMSTNELHCEWERCGATAIDPKDLSLHLQTDHLMDPGSISLDNAPISGNTRASARSDVTGEHVCQWMPEPGDSAGEVACGMSFGSTEQLHQHLKDIHLKAVSSKLDLSCRWKCCERGPDKPFSQKGKLERHLVTHTGYKPFKCDFCAQNFATFAGKEQHERTHTGERPFSCDYPGCGKSFATTTSLTMHKRHHTGEKPLKCPFCDEWFAESSNLSKHKKTHDEKGQHVCRFPGCGRDFKRSEQLRRHARVHDKQAQAQSNTASRSASTSSTTVSRSRSSKQSSPLKYECSP